MMHGRPYCLLYKLLRSVLKYSFHTVGARIFRFRTHRYKYQGYWHECVDYTERKAYHGLEVKSYFTRSTVLSKKEAGRRAFHHSTTKLSSVSDSFHGRISRMIYTMRHLYPAPYFCLFWTNPCTKQLSFHF